MGGQTDRLRGIAHHEEGDHRDGRRRRRHIEGAAPVVEPAHAEDEQGAYHAAAHVVGHVPDRDDLTPLLL